MSDIDNVPDTAPDAATRVATTLYLSADDHRALRMMAAERRTSAASLIRRALRACGVLPTTAVER